jgi:transposase-like protein
MSGRPSAPTEAALRMVARGGTISEAARKHRIALSTLRRAMRRAELPPRTAGRPPDSAAG